MKRRASGAVLAALAVWGSSTALAAEPNGVPAPPKVLGNGGLFFRADHPERLSKWYETHLGIALVPTAREKKPWRQDAGPTAFAPFDRDTKYSGKPEQVWMVTSGSPI